MSNRLQLIGKVFGALTVTRELPVLTTGSQWLCKCECGNLTHCCRGAELNRPTGRKHCGCKTKGLLAVNHRGGPEPKHGHASGSRCTREYESWRAMKQRCTRAAHVSYPHYGGRGITVCPQWQNSFVTFLADMGLRPISTSIDRIDNDGNYEPDNCRWATRAQQRHNQRNGWTQ